MKASDPMKTEGRKKPSERMKAEGLGIRGVFRVSILIVVIVAMLILAGLSYSSISDEEYAKADASIRSEVNYLCLQLESLGDRAGTFTRIVDEAGVDPEKLDPADREEYRLLSDPIGDILKGYTLAETGTVAIIADGTVVSSDDTRVPVGSDAQALLGDEVCSAIETSLASGEIQVVPFKGVFDEAGGEGSYGEEDEEAYLLAGQQGTYTVMIIEPMSMVYRDRPVVLRRELFVGFVLLVVISIIVDRLLNHAVARRIDKTNEALGQITSGNLETRVEEKEGTREFRSLSAGINITVEALQGWIVEAEKRMDSELAAARTIQQSALPGAFPAYPDIPKFDIYAIMNAAREVGGDFYDFFLIGDSGAESGKLAFLIADVSGKGVPAALFMMKAATEVRGELQSGSELSKAIESVSKALAAGNESCMFVTMWVGVLDYETGHVDYVNAGHNPPLLWQEGAGWRWMEERSGLPLGLPLGGSYEAHSLECGIGDKILLYTDGVTEAMNEAGELFGEERLEAAVNAHLEEHPEALVKSVRSDVAAYVQEAEQSDDITILVLELCAS